jgi:hypothetical protein
VVSCHQGRAGESPPWLAAVAAMLVIAGVRADGVRNCLAVAECLRRWQDWHTDLSRPVWDVIAGADRAVLAHRGPMAALAAGPRPGCARAGRHDTSLRPQPAPAGRPQPGRHFDVVRIVLALDSLAGGCASEVGAVWSCAGRYRGCVAASRDGREQVRLPTTGSLIYRVVTTGGVRKTCFDLRKREAR